MDANRLSRAAVAPRHTDMPEALAHALELMQGLGSVQAKRMFGGYGVYLDGLMFALWADEALYFKADGQTRPRFEALHLPPFTYQAKGRERVALSYHLAPAEVHEDAHLMMDWAREAWGCALRAAAAKAKPKAKPKPKTKTKAKAKTAQAPVKG